MTDKVHRGRFFTDASLEDTGETKKTPRERSLVYGLALACPCATGTKYKEHKDRIESQALYQAVVKGRRFAHLPEKSDPIHRVATAGLAEVTTHITGHYVQENKQVAKAQEVIREHLFRNDAPGLQQIKILYLTGHADEKGSFGTKDSDEEVICPKKLMSLWQAAVSAS